MITDPLASMRCWAVGVTLGGREYTIPPLPAAEWWPIVAGGAVSAFLDLIKDPDLTDRLFEDGIDPAEIEQVGIEAIEAAAGRPVMAVLTIAAIAEQHWSSVNGQLMREGVRWDALPLGAVLDAIHSLLLERFGEGKDDKTGRLWRDVYLADLERPLPGNERKVSEQALLDFEAMAGPRPVGKATAPVAGRPARSSAAPSAGTPSRTRTPSRPPRRPDRSAAPTEPPSTPGRSDPAARNAPLPDAVSRAS